MTVVVNRPPAPPRPAGGVRQPALARTATRPAGPRRWWHAPALPVWLARLVTAVGLLTVASAVAPAQAARFEVLMEVVPRVGALAANAGAATAGVLLILLAHGLRRRKRAAWWATTALAAAATVLHLLKGLDLEEATATAGLLAVLVAARGGFQARSDPRGRWQGPAVTALVATAGVGVATAFLAVRPERLAGRPGIVALVRTAAAGLAGMPGPVRYTVPATGTALALLTGVFGAVAVLAGAGMALRPARRRSGLTDGDSARLRDLLRRYGHQDSLGYFALRRDKDAMFSGDGRAAVAYRVVAGVSLAAGDPVGDRQAWPDAIAAWLAEAADHGWIPAVLGCSEPAGQAYRRAGLDALELGDEALLDVDRTTLEGRPMRAVRQAVARMRRAGFTTTAARVADLPPATVAEAAAAADKLRNGDVERGFSMALGRLGDPADGDCVLILARDPHRRVRGVLHLVPWGADGLSLDVMRGDRRAGNGLVELMVVAALDYARAAGVSRVSLNFAVFRSVFARGEQLGAGPVLRLWRRALLAASRFWQIESLYRANAKYRPQWEPRYLCFAAGRDLPRIGVAALSAEAFLAVPRLRPLCGRAATALQVFFSRRAAR